MFTKIKEMVNVDQSEVSNVLFKVDEAPQKIYQTFDYDYFNFVETNREADEIKVAKLIKSIKEDGYLMSVVIVNKKRDVIDGQHRVRALIELNKQGVRLPVYYIIGEDYGNKEMIMYNKNNHNWTRKDYLHHHIKTGIKSYIALDKFMKDYPEFTLGSAISIFTNLVDHSPKREHYSSKPNGGKLITNSLLKEDVTTRSLSFQNGELEMPKNILDVYGLAEKIVSFKPHNKDYQQSGFVNAIIAIHKINGFSFSQLMNKVNKPRIMAAHSIDSLGITSNYREKLNSIYNSNVSINNPNYLELRVIKK